MTTPVRINKTFSRDDRALLRAALIAYMEEHRIGVPTLQVRIAKAVGREPHLLPLKTLQRFLADTSRTNDALLSLCSQFAEALKPKPGTEVLAEAAGTFFETSGDAASREALLGGWTGFAQGNRDGTLLQCGR